MDTSLEILNLLSNLISIERTPCHTYVTSEPDLLMTQTHTTETAGLHTRHYFWLFLFNDEFIF